MREVYRAFVDRVGTTDALGRAHDLEYWHDSMETHTASLARIGFAPDGQVEWESCSDAPEHSKRGSCPHAQTRRLWAQAVRVLGSRASELRCLQAVCSRRRVDRERTHVHRIRRRR